MADILVLGAAGRLSRLVAETFRDAGWTVRGQVRPGAAGRLPSGVLPVEADGRDAAALADAARGADVVFHGLNPVYTAWRRDVPALSAAAIAAGRASGGLMLFPGNVYGFGAGMPERLHPDTPEHPTTEKGRLRVALERDLVAEAGRGAFRLAILKAGDFFGGPGKGTWFDQAIAAKAGQGIFTAPGPMDLVHAYAYLPDLAATFLKLATAGDRLRPVQSFHFEGHAVTLREMAAAMERVLGRDLTVRPMPWWLLRMVGLVNPMMRDLAEMSYLWRVPHRLVDPRLAAAIGAVPATPLDAAVAAALAAMGVQPLSAKMPMLSAVA